MILFKEDWDKYPRAIMQTNTKNKSWLRMAVMYRDHFKLENYGFHLALLNPTLRDVDPHSTDLTDRQKLDIIRECANNPWYFYREVLRIPAKSGIGSSPFRVDRGTIATLFSYHTHMDSTNIQLRQTGKTIKIEAAGIWLITVGSYNTTLLYGTTDASKQVDCVKSIKEKLLALPDYIYKPIKGKDYDNRTSISNVRRKNYIQFAIGQKDKRVANNNARGYSLANKIFDEVAEMINAHISIAAASGASNAVIKEARDKGEPYGTIFACTAGSLDRPEGEYYYNLAASGMAWNEILLDCKDITDFTETVALASRDHRAPLIDITMSWRQLGLSTEEFEEIVARSKREANGDMDRVKRECYSIWSRGGVSNPLTKAQIQTIFDSEMEAIKTERSKERVIIKWYADDGEVKTLGESGRLGLGIDTSNGINRDSCSITIMDLATTKVIGRADISQINLRVYADFVSKLLVRLSKSIMVIENKSSGQSIIDAAILTLHAMGEDPFTRIFNRIYQEPDKYQRQYETIQNTPMRRRTPEWYDQFKGYFGFMTTGKLRQELYDTVLTESVKMGGSFIRDSVLSSQMRLLQEKNGRIDHSSKGHDDAVISYLLITWFCLFGRNHRKYSIDAKRILSETVATEDGNYSDAAYQKQQELNYLENISKNLEEQYRLHHEEILGLRYRDELIKVYNRIETLGGEPRNMDALMEELKRSSKVNKKRRRWTVK